MRAIAPCGYDTLPLSWRGADLSWFSADKKLYDYQQRALRNALSALWLYYEGCGDYREGEPPEAEEARRRKFAGLMDAQCDEGEISPSKIAYAAKDRPFSVLSERVAPEGGRIPFWPLANRMGFWMATGSGKTPVMIKTIEVLRRLMAEGEIPRRKILILAPGELLRKQIERTVQEYSRDNQLPIRLAGLTDSMVLPGRGETRYYRADNVSDVRKKALVDWRDYENNGKWYVLLDEAHRGRADDSKRQAYYSLLARNGFLFNFSATFTDAEDIVTTVAKFNLGDFSAKGYGKRIYLSGAEFHPFAGAAKRDDFTGEEAEKKKRKIVLMSLIALALVERRVSALREEAKKRKADAPYHKPLLLTLTNSVNTEERTNDLRAFFGVLSDLASSKKGVSEREFREAKGELGKDLRDGKFEFEDLCAGAELRPGDAQGLSQMSLKDLRRAVFLDDRPGGLEAIEGERGKEVAFQLKTAAKPFALIRIGDTSKWVREQVESGAFVTTRVASGSYFDDLAQGHLTVLMGSRSFVESWDSVRPNVINFINIGMGPTTVKFILQSIGRGVRVHPAPHCRRRFTAAPDMVGKPLREIIAANPQAAAAAETLFVFATNRDAVGKALRGLETEPRVGEGLHLFPGLFSLSQRPKIKQEDMPLLIPEYNDVRVAAENRRNFEVSSENGLRLVQEMVRPLPDSVLAVAYGKTGGEIAAFRELADREGAIIGPAPGGAALTSFPTALNAVFRHLHVREMKKRARIFPLEEEGDRAHIVHFRHISVTDERRAALLCHAVSADQRVEELIASMKSDKITPDQFATQMRDAAKNASALGESLDIMRIAAHYYLPLVVAKDADKAKYIRHIVRHKSEADFLRTLENWLKSKGNPDEWDGWMFSKLDESLDKVFIPYSVPGENHRNHFPDFVFWMCRGDEYRIVFVDPHGTAHTDTLRKMDGFRDLFGRDKPRQFSHDNGRWKVSVRLLFFNSMPDIMGREYARHWTNAPADIFKAG